MKKLQLITGLTLAVASSSVFALGYTSTTDAPVGTSLVERHAIQFTTEASDCFDSPLVGGNVCVGAGSQDSEFTVVFENNNLTTCVSPAGTCDPNNVADSYVDGTNLAPLGAARVHSPNNTTGGILRDLPLATTFSDLSSYGTDANGKITSGVIIADSDFAGVGTIGVFFFPEMIVRTFRGVSTSPEFDVTCATNLGATFSDCGSDILGGEIDGTNDVIGASEQSFDYVTTPMGQSDASKAVPVPAYAAAALGLGLVGITIASSRRRTVR